MFSEYASRFLAQSQSRLLPSEADRTASPTPLDRSRSSSRAQSRAHSQRQPFGNPYQGKAPQNSRFPFAARFSSQPSPAPLFHSTTNEFREEDDIEEHDREVADFYALQRSRRDFGRSRLTESEESDKELPNTRLSRVGPLARRDVSATYGRGAGIKSSWTAEDELNDEPEDMVRQGPATYSLSGSDNKSRDGLIDVELTSTVPDDQDADIPRAPDIYDDVSPGFTRDVSHAKTQQIPLNLQESLQNRAMDPLSTLLRPRPPISEIESVAPTAEPPYRQAPRHDQFWATLYQLSLAAMFTSFVLSMFHNPSAPSNGSLGDTIYTTLHSSFYLLAIDTLVAVVVALLWLAMLKSFVRQLVLLILVAVPILAISFSLYPFISSFGGSWHGDSVQDRAMRWFSLLPALFAVGWIFTAYKSRHSLGKAIELLEFTTRVLAANPNLLLVGFATLVVVVVWTWLWVLLFTRLFLGGHATKLLFSIDTGTWCLAVFFVLNYLWTLSVISGIQRATSAATVSQWYFHRLAAPSVDSSRVVAAAFEHAYTTMFGTICLSTLMSLAIRLPLLILPRRFGGFIAMCFYALVPTSIATFTNPLTLSYAAIHSQPLTVSAQGLAEMHFISTISPTTTLTPTVAARSSNNTTSNGPPLIAFRFAKLLLHATRFITTLAFCFGGWVSTARMLSIEGAAAGVRGSLYAYVVGLVAGAIGWAVLGAMEGVLGGVLDAVVVCWGSEVGRSGDPSAGRGYCREAGELLATDTGGRGLGEGSIGL